MPREKALITLDDMMLSSYGYDPELITDEEFEELAAKLSEGIQNELDDSYLLGQLLLTHAPAHAEKRRY